MSDRKITAATLEREKAMADVMKTFLPQLFTGPEVLTENAPDAGGTDYWMLTNIPADILVPLAGLQIIADSDNRDDLRTFVNLTLRGVKGINGFTAKQGENIALGLGGGIGRKVVKRPGLFGRNVTNRRWKEKAEAEGAEIEE